jgi:hypothetical protein
VCEHPNASPTEVCNGLDDNCDGRVDEGFDTSTDPDNCGTCGNVCTAPDATAVECSGGVCGDVTVCAIGFADLNGDPSDGCEYGCPVFPPTAETCNGIDDDCDGAIDEGLGFDLISGPHLVAAGTFYAYGLVATPVGVLVSWADSIDGGNPVPNGFARPLDEIGEPSGPPVLLVDAPVSLGVGPSLAAAASGFAVAMCRTFGFEDYPSWRFVDATGNPTAPEHAVQETSESCTTHDTPPQLLWTGERHLFTWITSSTFGGVFVESSDASGGAPIITTLTQGDLSAPPRLAQHGDRVALVVGERPEPMVSELSVYFTDRQGTSFTKVATLPDPGGSGYLQPRIAFDPQGVLLVVATNRFDPGWFRTRIAPDGAILTGPLVESDNLEVRDLAARPDGGFWATASDPNTSSALLMQLDETGAVATTYALPEIAYSPILTPRAGRVHVVYFAPDAPMPNELHSVVYGCVP